MKILPYLLLITLNFAACETPEIETKNNVSVSNRTDDISICPEKNICLDCSIETDKWNCAQSSCSLEYSDDTGLSKKEEIISIDCDSEEELEGSICIAGICAGCIGFNYESTGLGVQCWIGSCTAQCTSNLGCTSSGCGSTANS